MKHREAIFRLLDDLARRVAADLRAGRAIELIDVEAIQAIARVYPNEYRDWLAGPVDEN